MSPQIVYSTLLQWVIYGNYPAPLAFVGMAVICSAGLCATVSVDLGVESDRELEAESRSCMVPRNR